MRPSAGSRSSQTSAAAYARVRRAGTATTYLAVALARMGHTPGVLYIGVISLDGPVRGVVRLRGGGIAIVHSHPATRSSALRFRACAPSRSALRADLPEVVIAHDLTAPVYAALRLRQLGLAFQGTLFVVFCHGTRLGSQMSRRRYAPLGTCSRSASSNKRRSSSPTSSSARAPYLIASGCAIRDGGCPSGRS